MTSFYFTMFVSESKSENQPTLAAVLPPGGEGCENGKIIPGQSIVFATLEVCLCVLSKRIPALNPAAQTTGFHAPVRLSKMTDETCQLIGAVITVMAELPALCSNAGQFCSCHNICI